MLARRTRISIETFDRGTAAAEEAAELMAPVLGWGDEQVGAGGRALREAGGGRAESQRQPDDQTADAARLGAPEIVPVR